MKKKIVYIAHPISGDVQNNLRDLYRILRYINLNIPEVVPCAPYIGDILSLQDHVPNERKKGIMNDTELIKTRIFDELWLTGDLISSGMQYEMDLFNSLNIPIVHKIGIL